MMPVGRLARVVAANTVRSPRDFLLSAFGIVIGIAAFVFFLGLSVGVRNVVLGKIFPIDQVEVVAPRASFLGQDLSKRLDDDIVQQVRDRSEVEWAVPRMTMVFPAAGNGWFNGQEIKFEVGGFADGIDSSFVKGEAYEEIFHDWESPEYKAQQKPCGPAPEFACEPEGRYWCDKTDMKCHHRVPVIISPTLLELYNGQFAKSHNLPQIGAFEEFVKERGGMGKLRFYMALGDTMVVGSNKDIPAEKRLKAQGMLVGVSDKAMSIGMTMPIEYLKRWNLHFAGEEAATSYSSINVKLHDPDDIAPFVAWLQSDEIDLRIEDSMGERFGTAIFVVTSLFVLISFIIVTISAINIAHNFFMQVSERRREIGVLRAVGATQTDVRLIILGESALIGVIGGVLGVGVAVLASIGVDWASGELLPAFPFKPDTYFDFEAWILAGGLLFSIMFCVLGGYLPARRASRMEPAQALAQK